MIDSFSTCFFRVYYSVLSRSFDLKCIIIYQDGMDLEMNLSRNRYRPEEDDFGDMV